ncbi:hypothetical protein IV203_016404 [Nitzschia inconspicua]|uniref:Uncharacterized protein n=1 Tax=Nitzschia inconspicua TaxID=303405 RepID=A0A9K3PJY7_9STRA|nr:hypothetical protein IV203_016404 [Nitzschia inconspicua]
MLQNPEKVAISPNWGTSWFLQKSVQLPNFTPEWTNETTTTSKRLENVTQNGEKLAKITDIITEGPCLRKDDPRLLTYMQNYMYRPTALLHELHREHKKLILRTTPLSGSPCRGRGA